MTTNVVAVAPSAKVSEIAEILQKYHFTGVPVVDGSKKVLGIITERDFIASDSKLYLPTYIKMLGDLDFVQNDKKRLPEEVVEVMHASAKDIMSTRLVTASPKMNLSELASMFAAFRINPIPVISESGLLVGIVSRSDLIKLFAFKNIHTGRALENKPLTGKFNKAFSEIDSKFAFVSKTRALYWFIISVLCFVAGFILGVAWLLKH